MWEPPVARLEAVSRVLITAQERTPGTWGFLCGFESHSSPASEEFPCISFLPYPHTVLSNRMAQKTARYKKEKKDRIVAKAVLKRVNLQARPLTSELPIKHHGGYQPRFLQSGKHHEDLVRRRHFCRSLRLGNITPLTTAFRPISHRCIQTRSRTRSWLSQHGRRLARRTSALGKQPLPDPRWKTMAAGHGRLPLRKISRKVLARRAPQNESGRSSSCGHVHLLDSSRGDRGSI